MISKTTIAAGLIALTSLTAVPAQAGGISVEFGFGGPGYGWDGGSGYGHGYGRHMRQRLSADEVRWMLRDRGYRQIRFFDQGRVYQLRARKNGATYYMVVSSFTGEILSRNRI